jgi:CheY-like chemotaxis protein
MHVFREVLILDASSPAMHALGERLPQLGFRVVLAKAPEAAQRALLDPRHAIGAAVVPLHLPALDRARALEHLRAQSPSGRLPFLVVGPRPGARERRRLRNAGVELAAWEPVHDHVLRFQLNRALAEEPRSVHGRRALRVPTNLPVSVLVGGRDKEATLYCVSLHGGYVATTRPSMPRTPVELGLPLPAGIVTVAGIVRNTNVPGNLRKENLPDGMGIEFEGVPPDVERALGEFIEQQERELVP